MLTHRKQDQKRLKDFELDRRLRDLPYGYVVKEKVVPVRRGMRTRKVYKYCMFKQVGDDFHLVSFLPPDINERTDYEGSIWVSSQTIMAFIDGYQQGEPRRREHDSLLDRALAALESYRSQVDYLIEKLANANHASVDEVRKGMMDAVSLRAHRKEQEDSDGE